MMTYAKCITYGAGGYRAEVYTDDDGNSGYGENGHIGFWYGTYEQCEALDPSIVELFPIEELYAAERERPDPFDLACERRHDTLGDDR